MQQQRDGKQVRITIEGAAVEVLDSIFLSTLLQRLPYTQVDHPKLQLGAQDIVLGHQQSCDQSLHTLGVQDGTELMLSGAKLSTTAPIEILKLVTQEAPQEENFQLPPGAAPCCSSCGVGTCCCRHLYPTAE